MMNHRQRKQFLRKQNKALKEKAEVAISSERGQRFILRDFLILQSKLNCLLTEDLYRLLGRYSVDQVDKLFGYFEAAVFVYQKSLRRCLKCTKLILKPDWLCESCRHSNAEIDDYG